ncbi:Leucine-rich repeat and calponin homology domain-containing protein 3 [Eumeta japonica]|uniref:Leucine-rich repeat and calponin homology domain-containing protein 3 n=1 Tax=Eumeta variegata TaxID=151549 RepID=A0A4C1UZY8_EUMVA|nr:Leucine-rich repeat and calponin homology domain-containing protein 3 [Eumeta japonica]
MHRLALITCTRRAPAAPGMRFRVSIIKTLVSSLLTLPAVRLHGQLTSPLTPPAPWHVCFDVARAQAIDVLFALFSVYFFSFPRRRFDCSNQLTELPREICQMPLQMLLVSNNQLTNLPKDIGRMTALAELDASGNRLTQMPMSLGDCAGLRALHLANNQLGLLPLQITYLRLEHLDVSCNCISSLPLELRNMSTLVTLYLENNPLVSPPTTYLPPVSFKLELSLVADLELKAGLGAKLRTGPGSESKAGSEP